MPTHLARARPPRGTPAHTAIDRSPEAIARHLEDAAHYPGGAADGIARPRSEADVAACVQAASPVLAIGAQSSVTGGATPSGGLVISTERLLSFQESGPTQIRGGAGLAIETLQNLLGPSGRWYAPFPTFTGATLGGIVATNAAGAATFKYGTTRPSVDGLTVVLACGCVLELERGDVRATTDGGIRLDCAHGRRLIRTGRYTMPEVPKCSAGYYAAPGMDMVDLFIGAEGTLGIVTEVLLRVLPARPAIAFVLVPVDDAARSLELVRTLRDASMRTWHSRDADGIDVAAIEMLDRRCLELLREDGVDRALDLAIPATAEEVLLIQLEVPASLSAEAAYEQIASNGVAEPPGGPLARFCGVLREHGVFDATEIALPDHARRATQFLAFREAAPTGVNRRVGDAKRAADPRIDKTAADMIVPFDRIADVLAIYRAGYARRGLDYAIWGHISDGNVHPNVIPRTFADVQAGRDAILEFGREVTRLGGSPLAEHGVGRSALKQALLRQLYGDDGIADMRQVKETLDPEYRLAPGVLFPPA